MFHKAEPVNIYLKILLIGPEGTGKTRAGLSFPGVVFIDTEGGTDLFARKYQFDVFHTKSMVKATEAVREAIKAPYQTIVLDSITSLYNSLVTAASGNQRDGSLSMKQWGTIKRECSKLVDMLMHKAEKHVVCCAWVKDKYAKPGQVVGGKEVGQFDLVSLGEIADFDKKVGHAFDFVFRMDSTDGYVARVVKARGDIWTAGTEIKIPKDGSFYDALIAALKKQGVSLGAGSARVSQTEDEAAVDDAKLFSEAKKPAPDPDELKRLAAVKGVDLKEFITANVRGDFPKTNKLSGEERLKCAALLENLPSEVPA